MATARWCAGHTDILDWRTVLDHMANGTNEEERLITPTGTSTRVVKDEATKRGLEIVGEQAACNCHDGYKTCAYARGLCNGHGSILYVLGRDWKKKLLRAQK